MKVDQRYEIDFKWDATHDALPVKCCIRGACTTEASNKASSKAATQHMMSFDIIAMWRNGKRDRPSHSKPPSELGAAVLPQVSKYSLQYCSCHCMNLEAIALRP